MKKDYLKLLNLNGTILKECLQHWGDSLLTPDVGLWKKSLLLDFFLLVKFHCNR